MNRAHSVQEYQPTTCAVPMEHDERPGDGSSDMPGVVALPEDQPGTSGLSVRTASEVAGVSSAFQVVASGASEHSVSSRIVISLRKVRGESRRPIRRRVVRVMPHRMAARRRQEMRKVYWELKNELRDRLKDYTGRRMGVEKRFVVAHTVDCLNELCIEIIKLTDNRDVSGSVQQLSESRLITKGVPSGSCDEKELYLQRVVSQAIRILRDTLTGLGINASEGLKDSDLERMGIDPTSRKTEPFKKMFTNTLTLRVAVEMIRTLKVQRDQLLSAPSDRSQ